MIDRNRVKCSEEWSLEDWEWKLDKPLEIGPCQTDKTGSRRQGQPQRKGGSDSVNCANSYASVKHQVSRQLLHLWLDSRKSRHLDVCKRQRQQKLEERYLLAQVLSREDCSPRQHIQKSWRLLAGTSFVCLTAQETKELRGLCERNALCRLNSTQIMNICRHM